jgi:hypothetical protein
LNRRQTILSGESLLSKRSGAESEMVRTADEQSSSKTSLFARRSCGNRQNKILRTARKRCRGMVVCCSSLEFRAGETCVQLGCNKFRGFLGVPKVAIGRRETTTSYLWLLPVIADVYTAVMGCQSHFPCFQLLAALSCISAAVPAI